MNQHAGSIGIRRQDACSSHPPWPRLNGTSCQEQRDACSKHPVKPLPILAFAAEQQLRGSGSLLVRFPVFTHFLQLGRPRLKEVSWFGPGPIVAEEECELGLLFSINTRFLGFLTMTKRNLWHLSGISSVLSRADFPSWLSFEVKAL